MTRKKMFKKSLTIYPILLCLFILLSLCLFSPTMAWDLREGFLEEWDTSPLRPYDVTVLQDGSVWLTYRDESTSSDEPPGWPVGKIFTINPSDGSTTNFTVPSTWGDSGFKTLDRGPDDTLWIADKEDRIVNFNPSTETFTEYPLPDSDFNLPASPFGISVAPDGKVWFTCKSDWCLGCYDPGTEIGNWQRFPPLLADALPDPPVEIAFADDGTVWFTIRRQTGSPGLGRLDPATATEPDTWSYTGAISPHGIAVVNGMVWFLDHHANLLVRFDPTTETFTTYLTLPELEDPHYLVVDPDGIIWLTAFVSGAIGTFDPATEAFDNLTLSGPSPYPMGISMSSNEIWWAETFESGHGGVGRFRELVHIHPPWLQRLKNVFAGFWDIIMLKRWETIRSPLPALAGLVMAGSPWVVPALTGFVIAGVIADSPWVVPALVGLVITVIIVVFAATRMQRFKRIPPS